MMTAYLFFYGALQSLPTVFWLLWGWDIPCKNPYLPWLVWDPGPILHLLFIE